MNKPDYEYDDEIGWIGFFVAIGLFTVVMTLAVWTFLT